ncbi:signal peptidase I [Candidatus Enterococcus mangumiae]|uniref:Signal peptidase I n=1 Tax=Candidatus Enterococcus mangumiae TaxID=2230878 RepID=A0ABZ2T187_9ENTE|nr:signal peptidase I [Enterococcus sp. DIV1094]
MLIWSKGELKEKKSRTLYFLIILLMLGIILYGSMRYRIHKVQGDSMDTALHSGEMVIVDRLATIGRYEIVAFENKNSDHLVKRIVGVPGDLVVIDDLNLTLYQGNTNKAPALNFLISPESAREMKNIEYIPADTFFVLGDNSSVSEDSRIFGPIHRKELEGRILFK